MAPAGATPPSPLNDDEGHFYRVALGFGTLHQGDQTLTVSSPLQNLSKSIRGLFLKIRIAGFSGPHTQAANRAAKAVAEVVPKRCQMPRVVPHRDGPESQGPRHPVSGLSAVLAWWGAALITMKPAARCTPLCGW
jgi:hypothetical protein